MYYLYILLKDILPLNGMNIILYICIW